jgi:CRISPR-associated protein Cas5d
MKMSTGSPLYAHTLPNQPQATWELLSAHAAAVAERAAEFAAAFGAAEWGRVAGLWHDLGKASAEFQAYLWLSNDPDASEEGTTPGRIDHSAYGARHAMAQLNRGVAGQLLAFCLAGHHAGLADASSTDDTVRSTLSHKLDPARYTIPTVTLPPDLLPPFPPLPLKLPPGIGTAGDLGFAVAFFGRMLFSALIDADRTATEALRPGRIDKKYFEYSNGSRTFRETHIGYEWTRAVMAHSYVVELEVAGPLAMFSRPDTGSTPTSYPVPTWSAVKGILESIAYLNDGAWFCPTRVEVCRRIHSPGGRVNFQRYATNYGGPERKADLFKKGPAAGGSSMQVFATVLADVCYRLHADVAGPRGGGGRNPRHHLKDLFDRRLKQGRCHRTPCLGLSEFTCTYWGPPREGVTEVDDRVGTPDAPVEIPSMLLGVWDTPQSGRYAPLFRQDVRVAFGVLRYDVPTAWQGATDAQ